MRTCLALGGAFPVLLVRLPPSSLLIRLFLPCSSILQSESTGTKTFTLFGPAGGGTNLTAFHFETKARRAGVGGVHVVVWHAGHGAHVWPVVCGFFWAGGCACR